MESSKLQQILQGRYVLRLTACQHCAHRLLLRTGNNVTDTGKEHSATNKAIHNHFLYPTHPEWWEALSKSHRLAYPAIEGKSPDGIACNIVIPALQPCQSSCHNSMGFRRSDILKQRYLKWVKFKVLITVLVNNCRSQWPRGLRRRSSAARLLRLWVRIPPGGHGCLSVVSVVCCQVEASATDWSLVQRIPTDCGASLCVIKKPRKRGG